MNQAGLNPCPCLALPAGAAGSSSVSELAVTLVSKGSNEAGQRRGECRSRGGSFSAGPGKASLNYWTFDQEPEGGRRELPKQRAWLGLRL